MASHPPHPAGADYRFGGGPPIMASVQPQPNNGGAYSPANAHRPPNDGAYAPANGGAYSPPNGGSYPPPNGGAYPPANRGTYPPPTGYPPHSSAPGGGANLFAALVPSTFGPGTDPTIAACFQAADRDRSGMIDDRELQSALSGFSHRSFSLRTVRLLMYLFTNKTNVRVIGPKEFTSVFQSLQNWRAIFESDRSGWIDAFELREALHSLGYSVPPTVLDLLVSKFDRTGGTYRAIEYDNFIECCLTVKGLTERFKEKDAAYSGSANFSYEAFMLTVPPFLIA